VEKTFETKFYKFFRQIALSLRPQSSVCTRGVAQQSSALTQEHRKFIIWQTLKKTTTRDVQSASRLLEKGPARFWLSRKCCPAKIDEYHCSIAVVSQSLD